MVMPKMGRTTLPYCRICSTRPRLLSMGIAKPTPLFAPLPARTPPQLHDAHSASKENPRASDLIASETETHREALCFGRSLVQVLKMDRSP